MATRTLQEMAEYLQGLRDNSQKASGLALIQTMTLSEKYAKQNAKKQFTGRGGRKLSGRLLNSIFSEYSGEGKDQTGYLGTRGIPYGAIHEFGQKGHPLRRKRRWLWIKTEEAWKNSTFKRLTPSEFYKRAKRKNSGYFYFGGAAMYEKNNGDEIPLFWLKKNVDIPERPYLRPAIEDASGKYLGYYQRILRQLVGGS